MQKEEIPLCDLGQYTGQLLDALEQVCESAGLRNSLKSCEFLRHIVRHAMEGRTDELKERLIGISLLGRETTYDTGSDAGVRVRANDLRKRLAAYNASLDSESSFTFDLPTGSYVPRFFHSPLPTHEAAPNAAVADLLPPSKRAQHPAVSPLPLRNLAAPTVVALFLCTICIRWQLAQEHPFVAFWQTILQEHQAVLYVPPIRADGIQGISMVSVEETSSLLNLAGQFHSHFRLTTGNQTPLSSSEILVTIGPYAAMSSQPFPDLIAIENTPEGRVLVSRNRNESASLPSGSAAVLTIANAPQRSIAIDGTDDAAVTSLIQMLCEKGTFPEELSESFQNGTVTQMIFPMDPQKQPVVFRRQLSQGGELNRQEQ